MTDRIFISGAFGFVLGILYASYVPVSISLIIFIGVVSATLLVVGSLWSRYRNSLLVASLFIIFAAMGMLRFYMKDMGEQKHVLDNFVGELIVLDGSIKSEVENRENSQRIILSAETIEYLGHTYKIDSKILVTTDFFPEFYYGDMVRVTGKLKKPENFTTDVGKIFDYESYLMKDGIYYTVSFADIEYIRDGEGNFIKTQVLALKKSFLENIESHITAPESGLISGLLLGVKGSLGTKLHQAFVDTGLVHIIVLSGYNVTIIAEAVIKTLSFLSITAGLYVGAVFILLFAVMTGGGATIIRASIMALLALLARATGRGYEITRALIIAGVAMIFQNPYILAFDISFQLSFLATLGLIYVTPVFDRIGKRLPNVLAFRDIMSATLATQVFVLPFLLYKIGNLSIIAPVTNILVLPLIPMTMFFGFLSGLFSFVMPILGAPFAFVAFLLLKYEIFIVETFAKLPLASFTISRFPLLVVIICYIFIFYFLYKFYNKKTDATKVS